MKSGRTDVTDRIGRATGTGDIVGADMRVFLLASKRRLTRDGGAMGSYRVIQMPAGGEEQCLLSACSAKPNDVILLQNISTGTTDIPVYLRRSFNANGLKAFPGKNAIIRCPDIFSCTRKKKNFRDSGSEGSSGYLETVR